MGRRRRPPASGSNRPFPHFFIEGDRLVKVGESRPGADTPYYRHETPREVFDYVADTIRRQAVGAEGPWTVRTLESRLRRQDKPAYHAYNVVAALRDADLVKQVGRGMYSVASPLPPDLWWEHIEQLWQPDNYSAGEVRCTDGEE